VSVDGTTCTGTGRTKKSSKQDAAKKMLAILGFPLQSTDETCSVVPKVIPAKSALKKGSSGSNGDKKVTFLDPESREGK